jgi:DNA-binding transcriptional ArsR family regulator
MRAVEVIEDPGAAAVATDPVRSRLLAELADEPASAAALAGRMGIPRQKLNYHLRTLEAHGLVEVTKERMHGGITERVLRAVAASYVISPVALGPASTYPGEAADRFSAQHLVALAARVVREVGSLLPRASKARKRLPTMAIDTEIRFESAEDRAAFADDLTKAVLDLSARYHCDEGRPHRLMLASYPKPADEPSATPPL